MNLELDVCRASACRVGIPHQIIDDCEFGAHGQVELNQAVVDPPGIEAKVEIEEVRVPTKNKVSENIFLPLLAVLDSELHPEHQAGHPVGREVLDLHEFLGVIDLHIAFGIIFHYKVLCGLREVVEEAAVATGN